MTRLVQNDEVSIVGVNRQATVVDINWTTDGTPIGVFVFLLDADSKFPSKQHLLFADRPTSPDDATRLMSSGGGETARLQTQIALSAVHPGVQRVRFVLAVTQGNTLLTNAVGVHLTAWDPVTGASDASYAPNPGEMDRCLVLADLYRNDGGWILEAKGHGFTGSIADLANRVGVAS